AAALFAFIFLDLKRRRTIEERILFLICCIVFLHPLIVDVLPFSRIGSIHYPIFPLSLVLLALVGSLWWEITTRRTVFRVVFAGILLSTLAVNLRHDFQ